MNSVDGSLTRRAHQPALDGVRGVSVAMVLLFHGGFTWMTGGYVGVSVFFTLSGFLITGLLVSEHDDTGGISASRFYARRVRRLMPASLLCLAAVSVAAAMGEFGGLPHVRRDILASLFQVANWNALANGTSYADLIARSGGQLGPVDHFWSLSVEEQFYWVWPLVCMVLLARGRSPRSVRRGIVTLALAGMAAAPIIAHVWGPDAAYWATPARLGEILVGAALAVVMSGRRWSWRGLPWLGLTGLAVIVWASITWPSGSGPAYTGWLGVFALASAALIAGLQAASPLRTVLGVAPLAYLGRISYGVYLYHWPVFAIIDDRRVDAGLWGLFAIRIAVTMVIAVASYHLFEQPIRHGRSPGRKVAVTTLAAIAAVTALVFAVVPAPVPVFSGETEVPATFASTTTIAPTSSVATTTTESPTDGSAAATTSVGATVPPPSTTPPPTGPVTVLLLGDSTMVALAEGISDWAEARPDQMQVASIAAVGCGLVRDSTMLGDDDRAFEKACARSLDVELPKLLESQVPEVVTIMITIPDVVERVWNDTEGSLRPIDPRYAERLAAAYRDMADRLIAAGVRHIVWVVPPFPNELWPRSAFDPLDPADWEVFVDTILDTAAQHPDAIDVVRLDDWVAAHGEDLAMRPDGLHFEPEAALDVAERYMGPLIMQVARG
ncbi:MAG: acyltransferase [Actinobacteria bacterium]|nr:acyltransferase [Actinomycetota bacterium]